MSIAKHERLLAFLNSFINAPSWAESRRIAGHGRELPSKEALAGLDEYWEPRRH